MIKEKGLPYNEKMFQRMKRERYEALTRPHQPHLNHHHTHCEIEKPTEEKNENQLDGRHKGKPIVLSVEVEEGRIEKLVIGDGEHYK